MVGEEAELIARHRNADEMQPYERLLAMRCAAIRRSSPAKTALRRRGA